MRTICSTGTSAVAVMYVKGMHFDMREIYIVVQTSFIMIPVFTTTWISLLSECVPFVAHEMSRVHCSRETLYCSGCGNGTKVVGVVDSVHAKGTYSQTRENVYHRRQIYFGCSGIGWLQLVGSLKLYVSFAKEPYKRDYTLQKRPLVLRSLLIEAAPYWWYK